MDSESENFEKIGYSEEELLLKRSTGTGYVLRYGALVLFWVLWIGMIGGATLILIVNNHDISTTVAPSPTQAVKLAFSPDQLTQNDTLHTNIANSLTSNNRIPKQAFLV